jgi:hypothetical protein
LSAKFSYIKNLAAGFLISNERHNAIVIEKRRLYMLDVNKAVFVAESRRENAAFLCSGRQRYPTFISGKSLSDARKTFCNLPEYIN